MSLRQGDLHTLLRQFDQAETSLRRSLHLNEQLDEASARRKALVSLGLLNWHRGRNAAACEFMEKALVIDRQLKDSPAVIDDLTNLGSVSKGTGDFDRALAYFNEALAICDEIDHPVRKAHVGYMIGGSYTARGELEAARRQFELMAEHNQNYGLPLERGYPLSSLAHVHLQPGNTERSIELYQETVDLYRSIRYAEGLSQTLRISEKSCWV